MAGARPPNPGRHRAAQRGCRWSGVTRRSSLTLSLPHLGWLPLLCFLVLFQVKLAAQLPHRRHSRGRGAVLNQEALARRKILAQEYEPPPCEWCHGRRDGVHADTLAQPPSSRYFTCRDGQLVHLDVCPGGLCFDEASNSCVDRCQGLGSRTGAPVDGAATAGANKSRHRGDATAWRSQSQQRRRWAIGRQQRRRWAIRRLQRRRWEPSSGQQRGDESAGEAQPGRSEGAGSASSRRTLRQHRALAGSRDTRWPQVNALIAFKHANSDPLGALRTWVVPRNSTTPAFVCKRWKGVACGGSTGTEVVALNLGAASQGEAEHPLFGDLALMQSIPPQFGNLTALTSLDLSYLGMYGGISMGGLVGSLPFELGGCTNLETLNLQFNALSGSLPDSLSRLQKLTSLQLGYNLFDAPFPPVLTTLASLSYLNLLYIGFAGPIPEGISNLKSLTYLTIRLSPVSGRLPPTLGALPNLQYLYLAGNPYLQGSLPPSLSRLRKLQFLSLSDMNLTGTLPPARWWGALTSLTYLELNASGLSGTLPGGMPPALEALVLANSQFSGPLPEPFVRSLCIRSGGAATLSSLDIQGNQLSGSIPAQLSLCGLSELYLHNNLLEGGIPRAFFSRLAPTLNFIKLGNNRLSGTLPADLLKLLSSASNVNISGNRFTGRVPRTLYATESLHTYDVSGNLFEGNVSDMLHLPGGLNVTVALSNSRFAGRVPKTWLRSMFALYMDGNPNITGPLPDPVDCQVLQHLDISRNSFSGGIPKGVLRKCPGLLFFSAAESGLSGPIPSPGNASGNVQELQLSGNRLNGSLPAGLSLLRGLKALDVSRNELQGPVPTWLTSLVGLTSLDASFNNLSGPLPPELRVLSKLVNLTLSHNALSGNINETLAPPNLNFLRSLDLSFNSLNGTIPWGFANASTLVLNLSYNQLSGQVPGYDAGALAAHPSALINNSDLCGGAGFPPCPASGLSTGAEVGIIVGSVLLGLLLGGALAAIWWFCWFRKRRADPWDGVLMEFHDFDPPLTTRALVDATEDFSDEYLLGRGGFGGVYRAVLSDGTVVAVKRLQEGGHQGHQEFRAEIEFLGEVRHKNLVRLLAAYVALPPHNERLLVYEFLPGGSLDSIPTEGKQSLYRLFEVRRRICTDIARGLKYLHHDCNPGIVHCDMKPSNVLLDDNLVAHVADFGLAQAVRLEAGKQHMTMDKVFGTPGFVAPEFFSLHRLSFKSDVYAFGVTLIRIMTGRKTTDDDIVSVGLRRWATANGASILDPALDVESEEEAEMAVGVIKLGVLCTARVPVDRPGMDEVVQILENLHDFVAKE